MKLFIIIYLLSLIQFVYTTNSVDEFKDNSVNSNGPYSLDSSPTDSTLDLSNLGKDEVMENTWIVELSLAPTVEGSKSQYVKEQQSTFLTELHSRGIQFTVRTSFEVLLNAISLEIPDAASVEVIENIASVKKVWPMLKISQPKTLHHETDSIEPLINSAANMTGAFYSRTKYGLSGRGIRVGVIDSGIDYGHPALGGCFGKGCRVQFGHDFVGDDYTVGQAPMPDSDPMDCGGHGTHVAGIIGGKDDKLTGVAPEVILGSYRVFGCSGPTASDIIVAAMERAFEDGMDIINLSLGGGSSWAGYPTAVAGDRLSRAGLIVIAAMGNDGQYGLWEVSAPSVGKEVIAVASFDNSVYAGRLGTVRVKDIPETRNVQRNLAYNESDDETNTEEELDEQRDFSKKRMYKRSEDYVEHIEVTVPDKQKNEPDSMYEVTSPAAQGAKLYETLCSLPRDKQLDFENKAVLILRGVCTFDIKLRNAASLNASAVFFYNNVGGALKVSMPEGPPILYFSIKQQAGEQLQSLLKPGKSVTIQVSSTDSNFANPTSGRISSFSSWGPGPDLDIKPDIGAPGGLIFSTYPRILGSYATLSGTSMATPHIAGCVALYLEAMAGKDVLPADVRRVLQNTAVPSYIQSDDDAIDSVVRQGAGMVQIDKAIASITSVYPSKMPLKEDPIVGPIKTGFFSVRNNGKSNMQYSLEHIPAVSVSAVNPWEPSWQKYSVKAKIVPQRFSLAPGSSKRVLVFLDPSVNLDNAAKWIYSGYIKVQPTVTGSGKSAEPVHVPYAGFKGRYMDMRVFPQVAGLPALIKYSGPKTVSSTDRNFNFTLVNEISQLDNKTVIVRFANEARILYSLQHPTPLIEVFLRDANTNRLLGKVDELRWNGRSKLMATSAVSTYSWDGCVQESLYTINWKGMHIGVNKPGTGFNGGGVTVDGKFGKWKWGFGFGNKGRDQSPMPDGISETPQEEEDDSVKSESVNRIPVPKGKYFLVFKAQKAGAAWWSHIMKNHEEWKSPVINVIVPRI